MNRLAAKCSSSCRINASRSASPANSTATPLSLSGELVGVALKPLQLSPRNPGKVVHPN